MIHLFSWLLYYYGPETRLQPLLHMMVVKALKYLFLMINIGSTISVKCTAVPWSNQLNVILGWKNTTYQRGINLVAGGSRIGHTHPSFAKGENVDKCQMTAVWCYVFDTRDLSDPPLQNLMVTTISKNCKVWFVAKSYCILVANWSVLMLKSSQI